MATVPAPARPFAAGLPADPASLRLQHEVEQLLYLEARRLDEWDLGAWLALDTSDARYVAPTTCRRRMLGPRQAAGPRPLAGWRP